jgi:hypothetical protein
MLYSRVPQKFFLSGSDSHYAPTTANKPRHALIFVSLAQSSPADPQMIADTSSGDLT